MKLHQVLSASGKAQTPETLVWFSGGDVRRFDWERGEWTMRLPMDARARLDRLKAGAALVKDHVYDRSVDDVLGEFTDAWIDSSGRGLGTVRWDKTPAAEEARQRVESGILKFVSMEVAIDGFTRINGAAERIPLLEAIGWEPLCVALVAVPADGGARFLGATCADPMPEYSDGRSETGGVAALAAIEIKRARLRLEAR